MSETADRFRRVGAGFTETIAAVGDEAWSNPSPCDGWTARDVVGHLVDWIPGPGVLLGVYDIDAGPIAPVDDDPIGAWTAVRDAVQAGLDDPETAQRVEDCGPLGPQSFESAVNAICIGDVLIHTWDLARAAGLPVELDADEVARQLTGVTMIPPEIDAAMRASGHFGPRIGVPDDADPTTRLLAFYGRAEVSPS
ncbi:MAG: TIGR03086 family protein [Acidimicrobiaceae bacterium]|nr:TIGR03086 family protein [Acidimicrobiaceae bacterium]